MLNYKAPQSVSPRDSNLLYVHHSLPVEKSMRPVQEESVGRKKVHFSRKYKIDCLSLQCVTKICYFYLLELFSAKSGKRSWSIIGSRILILKTRARLCFIMRTLWRFLDSIHIGVRFSWLRSSLWLQFKPQHIAAGAAFLAARFLNFDLSYYRSIWHEFQTTPSILQDVVQQLMELF